MAFKMKGSPMKRNFGVGASPMKNYKKGYYGEGSSMKLTDEETYEPQTVKSKNNVYRKGTINPATQAVTSRGEEMFAPYSPQTKVQRGKTKPQSQMTDAEYEAYLKSLEKKK
jgi:hypothetical protein